MIKTHNQSIQAMLTSTPDFSVRFKLLIMTDKENLQKQLDGCNYEMVKTILIKNFAGGVIPTELASLFDKFTANPCYDTAVALIQYDSKFLAFFELARHGGFTEHLFRKGDIK